MSASEGVQNSQEHFWHVIAAANIMSINYALGTVLVAEDI